MVIVVTPESDSRSQPVIISDGIIAEIGPSVSVNIPENAYVIEGQDKYLMPGLTDMHVHIWDPDYLMHFLVNGVTTIRNMWGENLHLTWRQEIRAGTRYGPELYTTGPILEGKYWRWQNSRHILTVEQARSIVRENKSAGYDFIKIYDTIKDKEIYDAIIDEANNQNIRVVGHPAFVADSMGAIFNYAFNTQIASLEHMQWYLMYSYNMPVFYTIDTLAKYYSQDIDSSRIRSLLNAQIETGTWSCPTFAVTKNMVLPAEYAEASQRQSSKYVKKEDLDSWQSQIQIYSMWPPNLLRLLRENIPDKKIVKAMYDQGVKLLTGTDCENPFTVWGFSLHEELQLFVEAGLTPFEVLTIATRNAAEFMNAEEVFGTVAEGLRADLLLLNSNPLDEIVNAQDRYGVMARGVWFSEEYLQNRVSPKIGIAQHDIDFGSIKAGSSKKYNLTVYNDGMCELAFDSVFTDTNRFVVESYPDRIESKYSRGISLLFKSDSTDSGQIKGNLTIKTDALNAPVLIIDLDGFVISDINHDQSRYPLAFKLLQNYPNPFNPSTTIEFQIPNSQFVTLKIYNLLGQEVATLVSEKLPAGNYIYIWDATAFASGVYLYRLQTDKGFTDTKKLLCLK